MRSAEALNLIKTVGVGGLTDFDGCVCGSFAVKGVGVDISCRKGSTMDSIFTDFYGIGMRVVSRGDEGDVPGLVAIAEELIRQMQPWGYAIMVRFCSYEDDKKCRCVYCHKPRENLDDYLCAAHKAEPAIAAAYAYPTLRIEASED